MVEGGTSTIWHFCSMKDVDESSVDRLIKSFNCFSSLGPNYILSFQSLNTDLKQKTKCFFDKKTPKKTPRVAACGGFMFLRPRLWLQSEDSSFKLLSLERVYLRRRRRRILTASLNLSFFTAVSRSQESFPALLFPLSWLRFDIFGSLEAETQDLSSLWSIATVC